MNKLLIISIWESVILTCPSSINKTAFYSRNGIHFTGQSVTPTYPSNNKILHSIANTWWKKVSTPWQNLTINHFGLNTVHMRNAMSSFIGFVVFHGRFVWFYWLQTMLKFNVLNFCFPLDIYILYIYIYISTRYLNWIWSAQRQDTVILDGQVSREIIQGNFLRVPHQYWWRSSPRRTVTFETVGKLEAGCWWIKYFDAIFLAPRWVDQPILCELTDEALHDLCAI